MVTVIDSIHTADGSSPESSELRHFIVETSVYDIVKTAPIQFSVACFLENTKHWQKVKTLPSGAFFSITTKVIGRIMDTNYLVLRVLDLAYLPRSISIVVPPTPSVIPSSKRSAR